MPQKYRQNIEKDERTVLSFFTAFVIWKKKFKKRHQERFWEHHFFFVLPTRSSWPMLMKELKLHLHGNENRKMGHQGTDLTRRKRVSPKHNIEKESTLVHVKTHKLHLSF